MLRLYKRIDAAMVRLPAHRLEVPPWPDLSRDPSGDRDQWRAWLAQLWSNESVAEAIEVASPVLARQVRQLCDGRDVEPRQVRRVVLSVAKYVLRMTGRATPFGLFAGVAPAWFGARLSVRWGEEHRVVARPDAVWLSHVLTRLEGCPALLRRLHVVTNNLSFVRGDRLVVPCQPQPVDGPTGEVPAEVSLRYGRPVAAAVQAAQSPITAGALADKLAADHPDAAPQVIEAMLAELVRRGVLITSLRPPSTVTDPLGYILDQLAVTGAGGIGEIGPIVEQLRVLQEELARHQRTASPLVRRELRATSATRMTAVSAAVDRPLAVDQRVDCTLVLPEQVAREAETAATMLLRLTPYPAGPASWRDYHSRFLDRYGTGALVPVRDLVDGDTGLGYPAGYRDSLHAAPTPALSERDLRLMALAQTAAVTGEREVVLDEATLSDLAPEPAPRAAPHTELCFQVHAPTRQAVEAGEFDLVVVGASRAAGTLAGRFLHLFDAADRDRMAEAYARLPTLDPEAIPAQVSCPPLYPRTGNVARAPTVLPHVISLAEQPTRGEAIPLDDLAVGGDSQRLYLMSLSRGQPVEPTMPQAVEFRNHIHPLVRFLCEITTGRAAACTPLLWEAASRLPFLPRLRYGRIVLSLARWRLTTIDLPGRNASRQVWTSALAHWRHRFGVPRRVYLGEGDQRLPLDLDEPLHRELLRQHLTRAGHATVHEAPDPQAAFGWCDARPHEIVVPLLATQPTAPPRVPRPRTPPRPVSRTTAQLPGASPVLSAKLYGHPDRQTAIVTEHLTHLLSTCGSDDPPQWWFLRYRDPDPHLRLRMKVPGRYGQATEHLGAWAADLRRTGLLGTVQLDTYHPEIGRYGAGEAMAAAEAVFAADSTAAVAQLKVAASGAVHPQALCAASFLDLAAGFTGSPTAGMQWLIEQVKRQSTPALARTLYDEAIRLANPHDSHAALRGLPDGSRLVAAWTRRRTALSRYRDHLATGDQSDPTLVLASLLHVHHARMVGVEPDSERTCHRLARAAALSWHNRTAGAAP